ncbi:MAG: rRNA-processing protein sof1 [Phylliscum demangeonii]|nr:MAG: rRNA-processing protein sof1 [Phylliscum demangeonii]
MKIQVLTRSASSHQAPGSTVAKEPRNLNPALHPFERAREYTRALNATKLQRVFAAPFIAQLGNGHVDGVYSTAMDPSSLDHVASGSGDGVVKVWDLASRGERWQMQAHQGIVKSICWTQAGRLLSCASDRTIKVFDPSRRSADDGPINQVLGQAAFTGLSCHRSQSWVAASSNVISIYDLHKFSLVQTLAWPNATDTINAVAFNQTETSILLSTATDRSICLYDMRTSSALARSVLRMACNAVCWNPMEAINFAAASEDHNIYLFDMRNLNRALNVLRDHVHAVMDVDFSPTGEELVSASYDRSIRTWKRGEGHSTDVYHTKRMQRVFSTKYTRDARYLVSGSDDGNVRLWRAHASQREGIKSARQREKLEYDDALVERYKHMPEIRRILRHRHLPKQVKKASEIKAEEVTARRRRAENERKHSKKGSLKQPVEREKMVLAVEQ